jgi:tetratricopeptide (TPR) repeat protein
MSEGLFDGILGGEAERSPATESGTEPLVAAVAANLANQSPEVSTETVALFRKQTAVLEVQRKLLESEHEFFKAEWGPRLLALRLRTGFQIFIALLAMIIGIGVAVMLHDAITSHSVVVQSFRAPPALAARGIDGAVVASGLLDELNRLQSATRTNAAKRDLANAWTSDVKLAVPEAGISIGEISRLLKARFGNDIHIDGELVETDAGGLALTVRGDGVAPKTFVGPAGALASLTIQAAEHVYAESQPAVWAYYLQNAGRYEEAITFCQSAYAAAAKADRVYLLNVWANSLSNTGGSPREALALYRAAVTLKPDFWIGYNNVMNSLWVMGDEEGAWKTGEEMRRLAGGRPGRAPELQFQNWDTLTWNLQAWLASSVADAELNAGIGTGVGSSGLNAAEIYARMHDSAAAELALKTLKADPKDPTIPAQSHFIRGLLAENAGDVPTAVSEMEAFEAAYADPAVASNYPGYKCWIAPAEEAAGHQKLADAVLLTAGTFVDCYRFRADILASRGDWPGAQREYAKAVALAPDLPGAYYSWGVALARHGDLGAAEAKFKQASERGPHWADPLKAWGDLLANQRKMQDALAKYNEALQYAPNWKQLKEASEVAAKQRT